MTQTNKTSQFLPDIIGYRRPVTGGVVYEFEHERLGPLGRISNLPHGPDQRQIAILPEGNPDDPLWEERISHLHAILRAYFEATDKSTPLPSIEEGKANARLYRRFTGIQHSLEMWDLARGLSEEDYACLLMMATHTSQVARPAEARELQLRLALLQACRHTPKDGPTQSGQGPLPKSMATGWSRCTKHHQAGATSKQARSRRRKR